MTTARCMKCKEQKEMNEEYEDITKNGLVVLKGKCPDCDTKMCRIVGKATDYKKMD